MLLKSHSDLLMDTIESLFHIIFIVRKLFTKLLQQLPLPLPQLRPSPICLRVEYRPFRVMPQWTQAVTILPIAVLEIRQFKQLRVLSLTITPLLKRLKATFHVHKGIFRTFIRKFAILLTICPVSHLEIPE